jgi:hypothetical protein
MPQTQKLDALREIEAEMQKRRAELKVNEVDAPEV